MGTYSVAEIIEMVGLSRASLYRLMEKKNLNLRKTKSGRYGWDENAIKVLESLIDPLGTAAEEEREDEAINKTLEKYGLTRSVISDRRYMGNTHSLTDFLR